MSEKRYCKCGCGKWLSLEEADRHYNEFKLAYCDDCIIKRRAQEAQYRESQRPEPEAGKGDSKIVKVERYMATDGKLFACLDTAEFHQTEVDNIAKATAMLDDGESVGDALNAIGYKGVIDQVLFKVTKDTQLVIEHWQCREQAGYQPLSFRLGYKVWVAGNTGSWSGSYGSEVSIKDLARYANDKRTIFAPIANPTAGEER